VKRDIPDYRKKQALLYIQKTAAADLAEYGHRFLAAGRFADAVEFFQAAGDRAGLETIRARAEQEGDAMLYLQCIKALGVEASPDDWTRIGRTALAKGKASLAKQALARSGAPALAAEIEQALKDEPGH